MLQIEIYNKKNDILRRKAEACKPFELELRALQAECKHPDMEPISDFLSECPDCGYYSPE